MVEQTLSNPQSRLVPMGGLPLSVAVAKGPTQHAGTGARSNTECPGTSVRIGIADKVDCRCFAARRRRFHIAFHGLTAMCLAFGRHVDRVAQVVASRIGYGWCRRLRFLVKPVEIVLPLGGRMRLSRRFVRVSCAGARIGIFSFCRQIVGIVRFPDVACWGRYEADALAARPVLAASGFSTRIQLAGGNVADAHYALVSENTQGDSKNHGYPRHSNPPSAVHHAPRQHSARERCRQQALVLMERRRQAEVAECLMRWRAAYQHANQEAST